MAERLCIHVCQNFRREVEAVVAAEGWSEVSVRAFPSHCGRPPLTWSQLEGPPDAACERRVIIGRACIHNLAESAAPATDRLVRLEQCFHLVAGRELVAGQIAEGAYLTTPGWLANWREKLDEMGFHGDQAGQFFQDFARRLALLDTGVDPAAADRLSEFGACAGLPTTRVPVGLDHIRLLLARLVLEQRLEDERERAERQQRLQTQTIADHEMAMDLLSRLAGAHDENAAIAAIRDLLQMLFAPEAVHYLRVENGLEKPLGDIPGEILKDLEKLEGGCAWLPDQRGFLLRIGKNKDTVAKLAVRGLAFPEHRRRYLNTALLMSGICGLAIENARNRRRLLETEKMASLGILVAGVAHEINNPVGIGLAAASSWEEQTRELDEKVSRREMTRADLDRYLTGAREATELIRSNLARVAQLVDAFRAVAVDGERMEKHPLHLRDLLDDVIRGFGNRFPAERIALRVDCDPTLEINSIASDWNSIFTNLVDNSLRHGFAGRDRGCIDIQASTTGGRLQVNYGDDGRGMNPEVLDKVFDPFFSTDLQTGMGLGMHLVYNLVTQRFGGSIRCTSEPGRGAQFHIDVPL